MSNLKVIAFMLSLSLVAVVTFCQTVNFHETGTSTRACLMNGFRQFLRVCILEFSMQKQGCKGAKKVSNDSSDRP